MIIAKLPELNDIEIFENVISKSKEIFYKSGTYLNYTRSYIFKRYSDFNKNPINFLNYNQNCTFENNQGYDINNILIKNYSRSKNSIIDVLVIPELSKVYGKNNKLCNYCGIKDYEQIDHYLPKSLYPSFAIFSKNLVLSCGNCNRLKSNSFYNLNNKRIFINPYYDILNQSVYICIIKLENNKGCIITKFELKSQSLDIIKNHFDYLKLIERMNEQSQTVIYQLFYQSNLTIINENHIKSEIKKQIEINFNSYGINHWKYILYKSLDIKINEIFKYLKEFEN